MTEFTGSRIGVNCGSAPNSACKLLAGLRAALIDNEFGVLIDALSVDALDGVRMSVAIPTPPEGDEDGWPTRVMVSVRDSFHRGVGKHGSCPTCFMGPPVDRKWGVVPCADEGRTVVVPPLLGEEVPADHPYAVHAREAAETELRAAADAAAYRDLTRLRSVEEYRAEDRVVLWWSGGVPVEVSDKDGSPDWADAWSPIPMRRR